MHCLSKYCVGGFLPGGTLLRERQNRQETICNMNLDVSVRHGDLGFAFMCFDCSMCVMNFVIIGVVTAVMEKHSISMMRFVCTVMFTALYCALHVHHIVWASFCVYNVLHVLLSPLKWKRGTIDDVRYNNKVLLMD